MFASIIHVQVIITVVRKGPGETNFFFLPLIFIHGLEVLRESVLSLLTVLHSAETDVVRDGAPPPPQGPGVVGRVAPDTPGCVDLSLHCFFLYLELFLRFHQQFIERSFLSGLFAGSGRGDFTDLPGHWRLTDRLRRPASQQTFVLSLSLHDDKGRVVEWNDGKSLGQTLSHE